MILRHMFFSGLAILIAVALPIEVFAHDSRPLFVEISEMSDNMVSVAWKIPPTVKINQIPRIILGLPCRNKQKDVMADHFQAVSLYICTEGISGITVEMVYPLYNPSISTLIHARFVNGQSEFTVLDPSKKVWIIPAGETYTSIIRTYFVLGVKHILAGIDHLMFLVALLYISRIPRRVFYTITSFTIAHTITIFLMTLGYIRISVAAAETVIAFSIVFLAAEIARNDRESLTWRYPVIVAAGFGLFHGMGFASALSEIGLPQTEKVSALLFFNLGVEFGQIMVIGIIFVGIYLIAHNANRFVHKVREHFPVQACLSYAMGIISAFWFIERLITAL